MSIFYKFFATLLIIFLIVGNCFYNFSCFLYVSFSKDFDMRDCQMLNVDFFNGYLNIDICHEIY